MSRIKIFRCAYFSMHFRIKFLLFNDFPSYNEHMAKFKYKVFQFLKGGGSEGGKEEENLLTF